MNGKEETERAKALYKLQSEETAKHSPPLNDTRRRKIMIALWERMRQWFGPRWENSYGTIEDQTIYGWHGALNRFNEDEIAGAMRQMEDWDSPHPPTFGEFKALCMAARSRARPNFTERRMAREIDKPMIKHLTEHAISDTAKAELERMRNLPCESKAESYENLILQKRWGALAEAKKSVERGQIK